jgi:DNA-3-methyladenine glycosylase I
LRSPAFFEKVSVLLSNGIEATLSDTPLEGLRCFGANDPSYARYHDEEWGRPVVDERGLYERVSLEAFQSGLAWITILRKREAFRAAFAGFDPEIVAEFGEDDVARLLGDAGIVRNRLKIDATIANARAILALRGTDRTFEQIVLSHRPPERSSPLTDFSTVPGSTPASAALAKELKRSGFRFVGPTTAYALQQAVGHVNDHLAGCVVHDAVEADRRRVFGF